MGRRGREHGGRSCRAGRCERNFGTVESRLAQIGVERFDTDIEIAHRIPDGAGADLPGCPIGAAARRNSWECCVQRRTHERVNHRAVRLELHIAAVELSADIRHPIVLDGAKDVPHRRQLQTVGDDGNIGKEGIVLPAKADFVVVVDQAPSQILAKRSLLS